MEAAYFLDYFINDIPANQVLQGERGVPIMKSVREALLSNNTPAEQEIYQYINGIRMEDPYRYYAERTGSDGYSRCIYSNF